MSSSSRARPFSFSSAVQDVLGPPGPVNIAVQRALPSLFDGSVEALLRVAPVDSGLPRVVVRDGRAVPAGTPVGLFAGHVFVGSAERGDFLVALPPVVTRGGPLHLGVDAAASLARFPSPTLASTPTPVRAGTSSLSGAPWTIARPSQCWWRSLTACCTNGLFSAGTLISTVSTAATRSATTMVRTGAAGGGVRECVCAAPLQCPRDRFLRTPCDEEDPEDAEEADWTAATDGWPRR